MTRWGVPPAQARLETVGFWGRMIPVEDDAQPPSVRYMQVLPKARWADGVE